jgi:hypothetical protein
MLLLCTFAVFLYSYPLVPRASIHTYSLIQYPRHPQPVILAATDFLDRLNYANVVISLLLINSLK